MLRERFPDMSYSKRCCIAICVSRTRSDGISNTTICRGLPRVCVFVPKGSDAAVCWPESRRKEPSRLCHSHRWRRLQGPMVGHARSSVERKLDKIKLPVLVFLASVGLHAMPPFCYRAGVPLLPASGRVFRLAWRGDELDRCAGSDVRGVLVLYCTALHLSMIAAGNSCDPK